MNREIKFRGKCERGYDYSNGDGWVYGSLLQMENECGIVKKEDIDLSPAIDDGIKTIVDFAAIPVIPETVGQFTGLHDKNRKEIYEGDIVNFIYNPDFLKASFIGIVGLNKYNHFCIFVHNIPIDYSTNEFHIENAMNGEIIGNIFDNPELINN